MARLLAVSSSVVVVLPSAAEALCSLDTGASTEVSVVLAVKLEEGASEGDGLVLGGVVVAVGGLLQLELAVKPTTPSTCSHREMARRQGPTLVVLGRRSHT